MTVLICQCVDKLMCWLINLFVEEDPWMVLYTCAPIDLKRLLKSSMIPTEWKFSRLQSLDVPDIPKSMSKNFPNLRYLSLGSRDEVGNLMDSNFELFEFSPELEYLELWNPVLTSENCKSFQFLTRILCLSLLYPKFCQHSSESLLRHLSRNVEQLWMHVENDEDLKLDDDGSSWLFTDNSWKTLATFPRLLVIPFSVLNVNSSLEVNLIIGNGCNSFDSFPPTYGRGG